MYQMLFFIIGAFMVSLLSGMVLIPKIVDICKKRRLFDMPNARKAHTIMVPRLGGICFLPCMGISLFVATQALYLLYDREPNISMSSLYMLIGMMLVYVIGMLDDVIGISAKHKLQVQILSACLLPMANMYIDNLYGLFGIWEIPPQIGMPLTVLFVVAVDNAMNLIDGIDGLCSGLTIIALMGFGLMFVQMDMWVYCVMVAGLVGVLVAYSMYNIFGRSHKIFMGDAGSLTLGFMLAAFCVKLSMNQPDVMPYDEGRMMMAMSFLMVPCLDVLRVMIVRKRAHEPLFTPDRNHIHHRLMDAGFTMHQTLGIIVALDLVIVALTAVLTWLGVQATIVLAADVAVFALFFHLSVLR